MKNVILIVISVVLLFGCSRRSDNCAATDPREPAFDIRIVDSDGNSLIGEDNVYKPSEITLTRNDQSIFLLFNEYNDETYITLYYPGMESGKDYVLKLNDQESEILNIDLKMIHGECFDFLSVENFFINGGEAVFDDASYSYIIQK